MRILYITAGAAGMYCGSCLRDNALATELMRRDHEVTLMPLYTPTLTDELNVSQEKVFFGGISVYLEQHVPIFRKTPWLLDRLWDSKFALKLASRRSIAVDPAGLGELTVSMLEGEHGHQRKELGKLIHWLKEQDKPDVVNLPNSLLIGLARPIKEALNRPICCTLQGEDLFLEGLSKEHRARSIELIRANVPYVDAFLAVSEYYADFMAGYLGIPQEKIHVVPIGINLDGYRAKENRAGRDYETKPFTIGYFARVAPEKGLDVLCEAYKLLRDRCKLPNARIEAAGYLGPEHKSFLADIERRMKEWGLGNEFHYRGVLDRHGKIEFLRSLDVLSVPSPYGEPKGMFLLEAMACGVPVVQPERGAFPEILDNTEGGLLVAADRMDALANGLLAIYDDPDLAARLGRQAYEGVRRHYHVAQMADRSLEVYAGLMGGAATEERILIAESA